MPPPRCRPARAARHRPDGAPGHGSARPTRGRGWLGTGREKGPARTNPRGRCTRGSRGGSRSGCARREEPVTFGSSSRCSIATGSSPSPTIVASRRCLPRGDVSTLDAYAHREAAFEADPPRARVERRRQRCPTGRVPVLVGSAFDGRSGCPSALRLPDGSAWPPLRSTMWQRRRERASPSANAESQILSRRMLLSVRSTSP
jgi:hypothetical protein